jgi:hypothetical protein
MPHDKIQYLVLDRRNPSANMARFYRAGSENLNRGISGVSA